jgi:hypothetical protein
MVRRREGLKKGRKSGAEKIGKLKNFMFYVLR